MAVVHALTLDELARWAEEAGSDFADLDFTVPLKASRVIIAADMKRNFAEGHDPDGVPWAALKRPRKRGDAVPLRDRGILMASLTGQGEGSINELGPNELIFGTNLDYAGYQHFGTWCIPARPFVGISREAADEIGDVFRDWIGKRLG